MPAQREKNEPFVVITCEEEYSNHSHAHSNAKDYKDPFYKPWVKHASAEFSEPAQWGYNKLKELYPKHTVVAFSPWGVDIFGFPKAYIQPLADDEVISNALFVPLSRRIGDHAGVLVNQIKYGMFVVAWENYDFLLCVVEYPQGFGVYQQQYILHEGSEEPARALLRESGGWANALHEEIYVFDGGFWQKDRRLWQEVQKANWDDVILKDDFKKTLKKDVFGFFESEELYKQLSIPWKRGIIMHGPPGNGKTISMKAIMKEADVKGYAPLYVRSFRSYKGEEGAMVDVFTHARLMSPCVLVLEDLDSLINNQNRSFFLNQLDGLDSNDGLLIIGTTNHLERIDPALRSRPSRFDRKFLFDDPDAEERKLYVLYWQERLKNNKSIDFPDSLVDDIVNSTDKFSFAFLKEAFVSTLVILEGIDDEDEKPTFADTVKKQISALKKQLSGKPSDEARDATVKVPGAWNGTVPRPSEHMQTPNIGDRRMNAQQDRIWHVGAQSDVPSLRQGEGSSFGGPDHPDMKDGRDMRSRALAAAALGRSFLF